MKFVGLFITLHIGLNVVRELWHVACDKSNSIVSEVSYIHIYYVCIFLVANVYVLIIVHVKTLIRMDMYDRHKTSFHVLL